MLTAEQAKRQRTLTRERTRQWRLRMAEARLPDGRQTDHAIAGAVLKLMRDQAGKDAEVHRVIALIVKSAGISLRRRGFDNKRLELRQTVWRRTKAVK